MTHNAEIRTDEVGQQPNGNDGRNLSNMVQSNDPMNPGVYNQGYNGHQAQGLNVEG